MMTRITVSTSQHKQKGMTLIEALVAAVLLGVIFLGLTYALSRAIVSQRYTETQSLWLQETRENLQGVGVERICAQGETPQAVTNLPTNVAATAQCINADVEVSVPGLERTIASSRLQLTTANTAQNQSLFGGDGELLFTEN